MQNGKFSLRLITAGGFSAFFLFGVIDNLKGPTLPATLKDLNFSYSQGGTLLVGAYLGYLVATLLTGILSDLAGNKVVILVACACFFSGIVGYGSLSAFWWLTAAMAIVGLGLGAMEVGGNIMMVDLYPEEKGRYLNLLAFFYGVGSMVVPLYAGRLLTLGMSWRQVYQFSLVLVIMLAGYVLFVKYPKKATVESHRVDFRKLGTSAFTKEMLLYYLLMAAYISAELGVGSWLAEFLQKAKSQSIMLSSFSLSLFFGMIMAGRFVGSFLVEKIGYLRSMLFASLAAFVSIFLGIFGPPVMAFFLPLAGLFFSIMFPTITAAVSDLHQENIGTILGFLFTFTGVGGMLGPWLIGLCSDWFGIAWGFSVILVFYVVVLGTLLVLLKRTRTPVLA